VGAERPSHLRQPPAGADSGRTNSLLLFSLNINCIEAFFPFSNFISN
jgi:hypothetical protein